MGVKTTYRYKGTVISRIHTKQGIRYSTGQPIGTLHPTIEKARSVIRKYRKLRKHGESYKEAAKKVRETARQTRKAKVTKQQLQRLVQQQPKRQRRTMPQQTIQRVRQISPTQSILSPTHASSVTNVILGTKAKKPVLSGFELILT